ncbi:hypothetical protein F511_19083 [Dorcoceras hygrometricum]|uniref:Pre-rRNA-processing protein TSR2 n=1 Tax=Dorcoceras hygrometricum TaxID=472368 RepID=A0A2Z7C1S5_9LAMI|nr:hypothetical protein F511_19083 [Dorcoceras hygrometricum]
METANIGHEVANAAKRPPPSSSFSDIKQDIIVVEERVSDLLARWTALQMAVQNQWGGCNSREKSKQLASDILFLLFHSQELLEVEDLENLLHERLLLTFNTEIEDGSIEELMEGVKWEYVWKTNSRYLKKKGLIERV